MATNAILQDYDAMKRDDQTLWSAVESHDRSADGEFVYAVKSTGVYCRPSCSSRRPNRQNVSFFRRPEEAEAAGFRACLRCRPKSVLRDRQSATVRAICRHIEQNLDEPLSLQLLGEEFQMSPFHLQRVFKGALGITPREYADTCRINLLKRNLQQGQNVTRALYEAGYGSSSRLYEKAAAHLGMTPDKYRRGAIAVPIRFTTTTTPLGRLLIAATDKGLCAIRFGESDSELEQGLRHEYPFAVRKREDEKLQTWKQKLAAYFEGEPLRASLPLDIQATAFQRKVWQHLQAIPRGSTESYSEVAKAIGQPKAARAVARACASNPIALAIPCHRVVREDGTMGGYRWGMKRKEALLAMEASASS